MANIPRRDKTCTTSKLLCSSPHLVHSRLDIVSLRLGTLRSPHVGVGIIHLTHSSGGSVWIRIGIDVTVALGWGWHALCRRGPASAAHMRAASYASSLSLLWVGRWLHNRWGPKARRMRGWPHCVCIGCSGRLWLTLHMVIAAQVGWQRTVIHILIFSWMARHVTHWREFRVRGRRVMALQG